VHLLVDFTVVLIVFSGLPALRMVATVDLALLRLVLSEVEPFSWEHFRANGQLEILVRNSSVLIKVKLSKHSIEIFL
jgi:hypothetical protein